MRIRTSPKLPPPQRIEICAIQKSCEKSNKSKFFLNERICWFYYWRNLRRIWSNYLGSISCHMTKVAVYELISSSTKVVIYELLSSSIKVAVYERLSSSSKMVVYELLSNSTKVVVNKLLSTSTKMTVHWTIKW